MTDEPGQPLNQTTGSTFAVYWRARDGRGTYTWRTGLTAAEADAQVVWCEGAHPEATLVWATQDDANQARRIKVKEVSL